MEGRVLPICHWLSTQASPPVPFPLPLESNVLPTHLFLTLQSRCSPSLLRAMYWQLICPWLCSQAPPPPFGGQCIDNLSVLGLCSQAPCLPLNVNFSSIQVDNEQWYNNHMYTFRMVTRVLSRYRSRCKFRYVKSFSFILRGSSWKMKFIFAGAAKLPIPHKSKYIGLIRFE